MKHLILLAASVVPLLAAPVATVTSAAPFTLDGHSISTPGVTSFPLVIGDALATSNGPAVLVFEDGSKVKLLANSSVKIAGLTAKPKVVLLSGSLDFKLIPHSNLSVTNLDVERSPERAMLAALDSPDPEPAPVAPSSGAATTPSSGSVLASPKFLIPAGGAGLAGLTTALVKLPPVSRRL